MKEFTNNLFSIGRVCDANCTVVFTKTEVHVLDSNGNIILRGFREPTGARMWRFNICPAFRPNTAYTASSRPHLILDDDTDDITHPPAYINPPPVIAPAPVPNNPSTTEYHRMAYDLLSTGKLIEYIHCI